MAKIPGYVSNRELPGNVAAIKPDTTSEVSGAARNLGQALIQAAEKHKDKIAKLDLLGRQNELELRAAEKRAELKDKRRGRNALAIDGNIGVYDEYKQFINQEIGKISQGIPADRIDWAHDKLFSTTISGMENMLSYQVQQQNEYKTEGLLQNEAELRKRASELMRSDPRPEYINAAVTEFGENIMSVGDTLESARYRAGASNITQTGILAAADTNPMLAKQMLEDKQISKALTPEQVTQIEGYIEEKRIVLAASNIMLDINQYGTYQKKLHEAAKVKDTEVRKRVVDTIKANEVTDQAIRDADEVQLSTEVYEAIYAPNLKERYKDVWEQIDQMQRVGRESDGRVQRLTRQTAENLKNILEAQMRDPSGSTKPTLEQEIYELELQNGIWEGKVNQKLIVDAMVEKKIAPSGMRRLFSVIERKDSNPDLQSAMSILRREHPVVFRGKRGAENEQKIIQALKQFEVEKEGSLSMNEIFEIGQKICEEESKSVWYNPITWGSERMIEQEGGINSWEVRYKIAKDKHPEGILLSEDERYKDYPEAKNVLVLPNGKFYNIIDGRMSK